MIEFNICYAILGLIVNILMFIIPLVMLLDLRKDNKGEK